MTAPSGSPASKSKPPALPDPPASEAPVALLPLDIPEAAEPLVTPEVALPLPAPDAPPPLADMPVVPMPLPEPLGEPEPFPAVPLDELPLLPAPEPAPDPEPELAPCPDPEEEQATRMVQRKRIPFDFTVISNEECPSPPLELARLRMHGQTDGAVGTTTF